jgi:hypothetical protein
MNLTRCKNGHFYDEDRFNSCPHCGDASQADNPTQPLARNDSVTVAVETLELDDQPTKPMADLSLAEAVSSAAAQTRPMPGSDDTSKTVQFIDKAFHVKPVVGWLVCVQGEYMGEDYRLVAGSNFVGRAETMDVVIKGDNSVSRDRHAVIVYDPKSLIYMIQPGAAKELSYLNDSVVLNVQELKAGDVIALGDTKLMFFPCMSADFNWEKIVAEKEE